jgi:hypothetical protein
MTRTLRDDGSLLSRLGNWTAIPMEWIKRVVYIQSGYIGVNGWSLGRIKWFTQSDDDGMFRNGVFFFRFMLPFCVCIQLRWFGADHQIGKYLLPEYMQILIGWKINGRLGIEWRFQDDASAAAGTTAPNFNQAVGWADGWK